MDKQKSVLLAESDTVFSNGMKVLLESIGWRVFEATGGNSAIEGISNIKFDLVISSYELSDVDGLEVLRVLREKNNTPFVLLCEHWKALGPRQAKKLGVSGFLNKPFKNEDFLKVVEESMTKSHQEEENSRDCEFVDIPMSDFITGSTLQVDLYLRMSEERYLKIGNKGGTLSPERVDGYLQKGVHWLYMKKQDFATYVGYNINLAKKVHHADTIEANRKILLTMHVTENLISQFRKVGVNRQQLEETSSVVMNAVEVIGSNSDTMKLLESMEVGGSLTAHSIAVAIWSSLIAKELGWNGHSTFFKIAICAIFHDIGNKEVDYEVMDKPRFELSREQIKMVEGHTIRGRDILSSVPGMLEDAIIVAVQHHELYRGGGYPYGIKFHEIHPLARLIGLANRLSELIKYGGKEMGVVAAFDQLCLSRKDFDTEYFKALERVILSIKAKQAAASAA